MHGIPGGVEYAGFSKTFGAILILGLMATCTGTAQTLLISEFDTNEPDGIEFTNVSGTIMDISGWQVYVYERSNWPAPTTATPGSPSFTFPPGTWLPQDGVVVLYDGNFTPPANAGYPWFLFPFNLAWNSGSQASNAILLLNTLGELADFVIGQGVSANVSVSDITVPFALSSSDWTGSTIGEQSNPQPSYHRAGTEDTDTRDDWFFGPSSLGKLNPDLVFPGVSPWAIDTALPDPNPTAGPTVRYTVTFNKPVTGIETGSTGPFNDFALTVESGILTGASILAVAQIDSAIYEITAAAGLGEGALRLDILSSGGIMDAQSHAMLEDHTTGPAYTVDTVAPELTVDFKTTADTTPPLTGTVSDLDPAVTILVSLNQVDYFPAVNAGDGTWSLLDNVLGPLAEGIHEVYAQGTDLAGNIGMDTTVQELQIILDHIAVDSISRLDNSPTNAGQVRYQVEFSSVVVGLETGAAGPFDDFALQMGGGIAGVSVASVSTVDGRIYVVTLDTGEGDGTLHLDVLASGGILNAYGFGLTADATFGPDYVIEHLRFTEQPEAEIVAVLGRSAQFRVAVTGGTPPYTYEWATESSGKLWVGVGADAPELLLGDLTYDHAGDYVCTVSDSNEVIVSAPGHLTVIPAVPAAGVGWLSILSLCLAAAGLRVLLTRRAGQVKSGPPGQGSST